MLHLVELGVNRILYLAKFMLKNVGLSNIFHQFLPLKNTFDMVDLKTNFYMESKVLCWNNTELGAFVMVFAPLIFL